MYKSLNNINKSINMSKWGRGHRGHDHMVAGLITTYAISVYHHCEFEPCSVEVNSDNKALDFLDI
jgi:hypothetical protein